MPTVIQADTHALATQIKAKAPQLGFDLVGIASAHPSMYRDYLRKWLDDGQAGTMQYLNARFEERTDPQTYFPSARSVICVAMNYHVPLEPPPPGHGKIARYALGQDYHQVIKDRLFLLADWLRSIAPESQTRVAVDTAPIMEKELAARAGIGWMAKHTCIINEQIGSWILLGEVLTTLDLPPDQPATDRCGTCTRCIDACPTGAITAPYQLDARRCISYLTIEHRQEIPREFQPQIGNWIFGCDICQDVCPWNRKPLIATDESVQPRFQSGSLKLSDLQSWTDEDYRQQLKASAMKRIKLPILQRNAAIADRNQKGDPSLGAMLESPLD